MTTPPAATARPGTASRTATCGAKSRTIRLTVDQVGAGPTLVQGQTVPNANVAVTVNAVAPMVNLSQQLLSRTVQADANGNFNFSFVPQYPIPGVRYDITMVSTRGNLRDEARLVLTQR